MEELLLPLFPLNVVLLPQELLPLHIFEERYKEMVGECLKVPAHVWKATLQGLLEAVPPTEIATITAPTLILWGDRDEFLPRSDQEALAAAIAGSRLVIYEGT